MVTAMLIMTLTYSAFTTGSLKEAVSFVVPAADEAIRKVSST